MKHIYKTLITISLLFTASSCTTAGSEINSSFTQKLIKSSLKSNTGYKLIESLTTEVGPRLAGSKAEERARIWALKKMKQIRVRN